MLTIGLTGGVGCGKSTVEALFRQHGAPSIDADLITRELTSPGAPALREIAQRFGERILRADGQLDRRELRRIVFNQPVARKRLEGILHPRVREEISARIQRLSAPYCLIVVPLLVESGMTSLFDRVLVVDCEAADQIARVLARDQCSADEARAIIANQATRESRLAVADDIISNSTDLERLATEVIRFHRQYLELARQKGTRA